MALSVAGASAQAAASPPRSLAVASDGDGQAGFWWATDSWPVTVPGRAPYQMPFLGGAYGGYIAMIGNWAWWLGCPGQEHFLADAPTDAAQAHANFSGHGL